MRKRTKAPPTIIQLINWADQLRDHPLFNNEMLTEEYFVKVADDVPPPLDNLEPGVIVVFDWEGMSAKWMNGKVFVRKDVYEKHNKTKRSRH